jgi:hypothetical protein
MKRPTLALLLVGFFVLLTPVAFPQDSSRIEKIAEGEYWQWQDGHPIKDTPQTWTIWRTQTGYEVEDSLLPDKAAALDAVMGAAFWNRMSPELQEEYRNASTTTGILLQLTKQGTTRGLLLSGKKLIEVRQVEVAKCLVKEDKISCKGRGGAAHLKNSGQDQLLFTYPFPLFFTPMLRQSRPALNETIPVKLAMLGEVKNKLQLTEVLGQLQGKGPDKLAIGEYTFDTEKYALALNTQSGARQITLWASSQGIVLAMEDSQLPSGLRVLLTHYKRYSDF